MDSKWALSNLTAFEDAERGRTRQLKSVLEHYRKLIHAHHQLQSENAQLRAEKEKPTIEFRKLQSNYDKLRAKKIGKDNELCALQNKYHKLRTEQVKSENERRETQSDYDKLRAEKDKQRDDFRHLQSKYDELRAEKEKLTQAFEPRIKKESSHAQTYEDTAVAITSKEVTSQTQQAVDWISKNQKPFPGFIFGCQGQIEWLRSAGVEPKLFETKTAGEKRSEGADDSGAISGDEIGADSVNETGAESVEENEAECSDETGTESGDDEEEDLIDLGISLSGMTFSE